MIMMGDKKKTLNAILGPHEENVGVEGDDVHEGHEICKELIDAVKSGSHEDVWNCLKAAVEEINSEPSEEGIEEA